LELGILFDTDPFISAAFSLTNVSGVTQEYTVSFSIPIIAQTPLTVIGGSIGLSLTDANRDGVATVSDHFSPIYEADIDGTPVLSLFSNPYSKSVIFAGQTVTAKDSAGLPGPSLPGPIANATIGITHHFSLTPGDRLSVTSFFVVEAIPEAGSVTMVSIVLASVAGVAGYRRRRGA
jgi:hypothetical protein